MSINLGNSAPGIMALLKFSPETAGPIGALAEQLLRGEFSTLTRGERELIFTTASWTNGCQFDAGVHAECAKAQMDPDFVEAVRLNGPCALQVDSPKMHELLHIAADVARLVGPDLRNRMDENVALARAAGASDKEIHDTVLIASMACMFNRYIDGLDTTFPQNDSNFFVETATRLTTKGYAVRPSYVPGQLA